MILKSLRLKNFRKFQDSYIEFPDGITGIVGLNGTGKSTIFEAVAWTLYGPVAARTSADQIKREGVEHLDPCRIDLEFTFGDDNYRIVREMTGKNFTASATATVNGVLAANGAEVVSGFIQKKLGMDFKSFYTSIFAKQKELNALSSMKPSERRPLILRMLGINALDEIISDIRSDTKNKKKLVEKFELDLIDETGKNKIVKFEEKTKILKGKKGEIADIINENKKNILLIKKEYSLVKKECNTNKNKYEKIGRQKEELDEKKILIDKKKRLEEETTTLKQKIKDRQGNIEKQKVKLIKFENLNKELKNLEQHQNENTGAIEKTLKKREENKILHNHTKKNLRETTRKKKEIEKMGPKAKCPTCERVLEDQYNKLLDIYNREIAEKNNEIAILEKDSKKIEEEYERLFRQKQALQKKNTYLHHQLIEKEKINTTLYNILKEIKREEKYLEDKTKEIKKISKIDFDEKKYATIKNTVEESYKKYQSSLISLNEIRRKLEKLKINQERRDGEKNLVLQQIKNLHHNIEDQQKLIKKMKEERKELQYLKMLNDIMTSFRIHVISQIRPALSLYASELFDSLSDGKYSEIELDENYNLIVYDNGSPYTIERFSGGEEDLANLCVRLAISEVITQRAGSMFNFIILDEIFGSQDNIRKQNIIRALNSFSSKFRQIFLITHIEEVKNFMENSMTVFEEESGISKIKIE
jgi:exonuclease SbcC